MSHFGSWKNLILSLKPGLKTHIGQVCRRPVFHNLDLLPFSNNASVVAGIVPSHSSQ